MLSLVIVGLRSRYHSFTNHVVHQCNKNSVHWAQPLSAAATIRRNARTLGISNANIRILSRYQHNASIIQKRIRDIPLLQRISKHANDHDRRTLLYKTDQEKESYKSIFETSQKILNSNADIPSMFQERIATFLSPGAPYLSVQWATWMTGNVSVPLSLSSKKRELCYVLEDIDPKKIVFCDEDGDSTELVKAVDALGLQDRLVSYRDLLMGNHDTGTASPPRALSNDLPALILYTSGTTGNPKGVVHTHSGIHSMITDLVSAWKWHPDDHILHFLPLHHVHGLINKLYCAVYVGASVEFVKFSPDGVWSRLLSPEEGKKEVSLFMAVPTVYNKLVQSLHQLPYDPNWVQTQLKPIRLFVSGSAPLPSTLFHSFQKQTGCTILERYGMTEFGMALSNPYRPLEGRHPGFVGRLLPSIECKIVSTQDTDRVLRWELSDGTVLVDSMKAEEEEGGELCIRSPTLFSHYWKKPEATREAFDQDGFFYTGDIVTYSHSKKSYRILGRASVDIIKSRGYKLSALEIETILLENDDFAEVCVLGIPLKESGDEAVAAVIRMKPFKTKITLEELREWSRDRMAYYKIPSLLMVLEDEIPKNAMGKVSKKQLVTLFSDEKI